MITRADPRPWTYKTGKEAEEVTRKVREALPHRQAREEERDKTKQKGKGRAGGAGGDGEAREEGQVGG